MVGPPGGGRAGGVEEAEEADQAARAVDDGAGLQFGVQLVPAPGPNPDVPTPPARLANREVATRRLRAFIVEVAAAAGGE